MRVRGDQVYSQKYKDKIQLLTLFIANNNSESRDKLKAFCPIDQSIVLCAVAVIFDSIFISYSIYTHSDVGIFYQLR